MNAKTNTINVYSGQSIQNAIGAANPGDKIVVHQGIYKENLIVSKQLTIVGLNAVIDAPNVYGFDVQAAATISGFKIQPSLDNPSPNAGIQFESPTYYGGNAVGNDISGFPTGVSVNGPSGVSVKNNKIQSSSAGVSFWGVSDNTASGNTIKSDGYGVVINGPAVVTNNKIDSGSDGSGIYVNAQNGGSVIINHSDVTSDKTGIDVVFGTSCQIIGNYVVGGNYWDGTNSWDTIDISLTPNVVVAANVVHNSLIMGKGINVGGCNNAVISSNVVSTVYMGISYGPGAKGIVSKNIVKTDNANVGDGFGIVIAQATDCEATNNIVNGGGTGLLAYTSGELIIKNNIITPKAFVGGSNGIVLNDHISNSYLTGNIIIGDYAVGISVNQESTANYIQRNIIAISGPYAWWGIILTSDTFGNYVIGNKITGAATPILDQGSNTIIP